MANSKIEVGDKGPKYNKNTGCIYEQLFMYEALRKDLIPHKPILDPTCHDLVLVDATGCSIIVQVKSSTSRSYDNPKKRGCYSYVVKVTCNNDRTPLSESYVDVLAVYCTREEQWYFIPTHKLTSRVIGLYPHIENSKGKYEVFKDCWDSFSDDQVCPPS